MKLLTLFWNWLDNQRWKYPIIGTLVSFVTSFLFALSIMLPANAITITISAWLGIVTVGALIYALCQAIEEDMWGKRKRK